MKTFIKLLLLAGLIVYLGFAFANFTQHGDSTICKQVNFTIADSSHAGFITRDEVDHLFADIRTISRRQKMDQIDGMANSKGCCWKRTRFIDSVSCYKSPNGIYNVLIQQRLPLLRVRADNGDDYYIDSKGKRNESTRLFGRLNCGYWKHLSPVCIEATCEVRTLLAR